MKYRNAAELLPPQLLQELQKYAQGKTLYIPKIMRKSWGAGTGADKFYSRRNSDIRKQFSCGSDLKKLSDEYFISEDAVKKIIYKKGDTIMKTDKIDYSKYFWQNDLLRIRRAKPDDWKYHQHPSYDSDERFFSDAEQELPQDEELRHEIWENYIKTNWNSEERIILSFETHDGKYVGGGNLYGIDERNGTFGMFVGADEECYALSGAQLMLDYAFNERRLNNCHTEFIENDTIYKPIFEKLGFKLEGVRRQQVFHKGQYWDEHLYGMLAEEFNAR
jgi:Acetyltransferases, including N-acetylases of ribosomal proteins